MILESLLKETKGKFDKYITSVVAKSNCTGNKLTVEKFAISEVLW